MKRRWRTRSIGPSIAKRKSVSRTIEPLPIDETFERQYEIEWLRDMPSSARLQRYGSGPGPILRGMPEGGGPFIVVVPGQTGTMMLSTLPDPRKFAVFNHREVPVIIDVDRPESREEIAAFLGHGLRQVLRLKEARVLVMSSCCDLIAYGPGGIQWEHRGDLFCCDEAVIDVAGSKVIVDGEHHQSVGIRRRTVIDAHTGKILN